MPNKNKRKELYFMKRFIDNVQRVDNELAKFRRKCSCGHTMEVPNSWKGDYRICTHCGKKIFKDPAKQAAYNEKVNKEEFMFKFTQYMKKLDLV